MVANATNGEYNANWVKNNSYGDFALCAAPVDFYGESTYIFAAKGTDNVGLIRKICRAMTCDKEILTSITADERFGEYTNTEAGMKALSKEGKYKEDFLGGQNPYKIYHSVAKKLFGSLITPYDDVCNKTMISTMKSYFEGRVSLETAKKNFESQILGKYPEELRKVEWQSN